MGVDGGREGRDDNAIIQFRVSVPLPILDRAKGRTAEARAEFLAAEAQLAAASLRLERDYAVIRQRFTAAVQQLTAYRDRIVPRADQALKLVRTGFDEGKFTFIDLLDTQRTTAEAHLAYQQKLLELSVAQAELETLLDGASPSISKFSTTSSP
jgi:cobalt-zinc-cadmium efflux system outer membrane protein